MVIVLKYKKIEIYRAIYIRVLYDGTVTYITVSDNSVLNTNNNKILFTEIRKLFEDAFGIKIQQEYFLK